MKRKKFLLLTIILLVGLNILFLGRNISIFKTEEKQALIEQEPVYDNFTRKITNIDDIINNKINGLVYIGRDTCDNCLSFNELLNEEISSKSVEIYKFDTDYWLDNDMYQQVLDKFGVDTIPALIRIKNDSFKKFDFISNDNEGLKALKEKLNAFMFYDG